MKRAEFLILAAVLFLPSCAVTNYRYQQRSGETMKIENGLISQTPTVVDLKVNPERVSVDTVWQNVKGQALTFGVTNQTNATIGRLLEIHGGDVLVQPQTCWVSERQENGVKTHKLTVSGYIGKYENFRTATQEDIDLINLSKYGPRKRKESPVNPQTVIYVNSVASPVGKPLPNVKPKFEMGSVVAKAVVTKAEKPEPKKVYNRKTGTKVILGFETFQNYIQGFKDYTYINSYRYETKSISAVIGKQNLHWFWGGGISCRFPKSHITSVVPDFKAFSVYLQGRRYFGKRMFAPYFDMRFGAEYINWGSKSNMVNERHGDLSKFTPKIDVCLGLSLGAFAVGIGLDAASIIMDMGPSYPLGSISSPALHLSLKF